ncbi:hypothetical protein [Polaribacter dokdonensis]|uniref:DNA primase n=1 Tax=Polaribacter dokdonensis DSW-5 TaxID=1300348 RepID=A0A0M9CI27_9FLAO|nr:hypothetical protein [Polaribacter dokdonensis]KOY52589.1 hypothetical protein I602_2149 [Polaribacter dokdonensis DSW-5]SEE48511.1 hypothetical protein SAMN05444353_1923 [Polaribacter dokdonensis DSW-5]
MKRVIVDYAKLTKDILDMLLEKYPDGYDYEDIITFKNAKGENVKAVELRTEDTVYLVKVSSKLENAMEEYAEDEDFFDDNDDFDVNLPEDKD